MRKFMNIAKCLFAVLITFFICGCSSDDYRYRNPNLPDYNFTVDIDMNLPQYSQLKFTGNVVYVNQAGVGINGVYVINTGGGFTAYEASCPNQPLSECSRLQRDGVIATCPCDDAEYNLFSGEAEGKEYTLKPYRVEITGEDKIRISN
jgi:nitrite reductase/ring-hydroxylating ferredoxin subunit